jgi:hypothetical protein
MDQDLGSVFVLTMQATAGPRNSVPDGKRYDLLVFARGATEAEAEQVGRSALEMLGWDEPDVLRNGEITDPSGVPEDLRPAMGRARQSGCSVIVYDEP